MAGNEACQVAKFQVAVAIDETGTKYALHFHHIIARLGCRNQRFHPVVSIQDKYGALGLKAITIKNLGGGEFFEHGAGFCSAIMAALQFTINRFGSGCREEPSPIADYRNFAAFRNTVCSIN